MGICIVFTHIETDNCLQSLLNAGPHVYLRGEFRLFARFAVFLANGQAVIVIALFNCVSIR